MTTMWKDPAAARKAPAAARQEAPLRMRATLRSLALRAATAASILMLGACDGSPYGPVADTPPISQVRPPEPPGPVPAFPAVAVPAQIYAGRDTALITAPNGSSWRYANRYVLRNDGTFELQSVSSRWGFGAWAGTYERDGADLLFHFPGMGAYSGPDRSEYIPAEARGRLTGTELSVQYNLVMFLSDFQDGVFVLERADF